MVSIRLQCHMCISDLYIGLLNLIDHGDVFGFVFTKFGSAICGSTRAKLGVG